MTISKSFLPIIALLICGALIYTPAANTPFIFDDHVQIVSNPLIKSPDYMPRLFRGSTIFSGNFEKLDGMFYRPLMMVVFNLIHTFFGLNQLAFHSIQIVLHLATVVLIYLLAKRFMPSIYAWLASLIVMIHPINIEAVIYSSNLQDILLNFFGILSLLHIVRNNYRLKNYFLLSLYWFLALLSKESGFIYILLGLFLILSQHRLKDIQKAFFVSLITMSIYALIRFQAVGLPTADPVVPIVSATTTQRLMTIPKIITTYITTYILPINLHTGQNWVITTPTITNFYLPVIIVISLITAFIFIWKNTSEQPKKIWIRMLIIWLSANLLLHSQLIPLDATVADRWFYAASIALTLLILSLISTAVSLKKHHHQIITLLKIYIILLSIITLNRIQDWQSPLQLMTKDYARSAPSYNLANNLGIIHFEAGNVDMAIDYLNASIDHVPNWGVSWTNLGVALEAKAETEPSQAQNYRLQAIHAYRQAISLHAGVNPYINLARLLVDTQIESDQITSKFLAECTTLYPANPDLWFLRSKWELNQNRFNNALSFAETFHQLLNTPQSLEWLQTVEQASNYPN